MRWRRVFEGGECWQLRSQRANTRRRIGRAKARTTHMEPDRLKPVLQYGFGVERRPVEMGLGGVVATCRVNNSRNALAECCGFGDPRSSGTWMGAAAVERLRRGDAEFGGGRRCAVECIPRACRTWMDAATVSSCVVELPGFWVDGGGTHIESHTACVNDQSGIGVPRSRL